MTFLFESRDNDTIGQKLWRVSWPLLIVTALLATVGIATLYSVSGGAMRPWAEQHGLRFLIGIGGILCMAMVPPRVWMTLANPVYALALALLALVPVMGVEALGAKRWIAIAGASFQPSEVMKVGLVLALARYYQWLAPERVSRPEWVAVALALIALPVAFTLRQPDLGSAVLFSVVGLGLMYLAGVSIFYFLAGGAGFAAAAPFVWTQLHDYQRRRIEIFLNPDSDPLGAGYHITQSKIALGSGGLYGKGYMQGTQSQLDFVPEKHTDFIFTMFSEEWGFVGAMGLLALYGVLLILLVRMALRVESRFGQLAIAGSALTVFMYVFINIAMVAGLVPVVGVPLPLVSYGGTAMITIMAGLGLAMSASVHAREAPKRGALGAFW